MPDTPRLYLLMARTPAAVSLNSFVNMVVVLPGSVQPVCVDSGLTVSQNLSRNGRFPAAPRPTLIKPDISTAGEELSPLLRCDKEKAFHQQAMHTPAVSCHPVRALNLRTASAAMKRRCINGPTCADVVVGRKE